jgi:hypothetical protein
MAKGGKIFWVAAIGGIAIVGFIVALVRVYRPLVLRGAVIKQNTDTKSQSPIANVVVSLDDGSAMSETSSDFSGAFRIRLRRGLDRGHRITLKFRHPDFMPFDLKTTVSDQLYVVRLTPLHSEVVAEIDKPGVLVSNVLVRYTVATSSTDNVGGAAKTFQIINTGNIPCNRTALCSPDGKWKAQTGSASLDAGEGNLFRNARTTCIAGPCPFTRIDKDDFTDGGRVISVAVRDWSDTATFLLQGEVFRQQVGDIIRRSYAVIFGRTLNFTVPPGAIGPSIVADMNRTTEVFPLGPSAVFSWADCDVRSQKNDAKDYRCELKPGYRFQ